MNKNLINTHKIQFFLTYKNWKLKTFDNYENFEKQSVNLEPLIESMSYYVDKMIILDFKNKNNSYLIKKYMLNNKIYLKLLYYDDINYNTFFDKNLFINEVVIVNLAFFNTQTLTNKVKLYLQNICKYAKKVIFTMPICDNYLCVKTFTTMISYFKYNDFKIPNNLQIQNATLEQLTTFLNKNFYIVNNDIKYKVSEKIWCNFESVVLKNTKTFNNKYYLDKEKERNYVIVKILTNIIWFIMLIFSLLYVFLGSIGKKRK